MIDRLRALGTFAYDFFIGDDPLIAAAVVISLGLTSVLASIAVPAWWTLPLAVAAVLSYSLHRATRL